jgi:hypothetical protein
MNPNTEKNNYTTADIFYQNQYLSPYTDDRYKLNHQTQSKIIEGNNRNMYPGIRNNTTNQNAIGVQPQHLQQSQVLQNSNIYSKEVKYDPYSSYLYNNGLMIDSYQKRRIKTTFINIDSQFRSQKMCFSTENSITLDEDPLNFFCGTHLAYLNIPNHNFEIGDKIIIEGVRSKNSILRTYKSKDIPTFEMVPGFNFMKIFYEHNIPLSYKGNFKIKLAGIKPDSGNSLGQIPINMINTKHNIKLTLDNKDISNGIDDIIKLKDQNYLKPSKNYFFIILPLKAQEYHLEDYNFKLSHQSLCGIPLNEINYNPNVEPYKYHIIKKIDHYGVYIDFGCGIKPFLGNSKCLKCGGNSVYVSKIVDIINGYPNQNHYTINLGRVFNNVVAVKLVNTIFPNTQRVIDITNNKLYWNDADNDHLYSISIPPGNYSFSELQKELEYQFSTVLRINNWFNHPQTCLSNHYFKVNINQKTNIVDFRSYKIFILQKPFVETQLGLENCIEVIYITIYHPNHGMSLPGDDIIINICDPNLKILSGNYNVKEIIDENKYKIIIENCDSTLVNYINSTFGGNNVRIYIPDLFRMRFDKQDTLGKILGFRNSGKHNSVTNYQKIITNKDRYAKEREFDNCKENYQNNNVYQYDQNYMIMVANPLKTFYTFGAIKNGFAKIILYNTYSLDQVLFVNTFVEMVHYYDDPINQLSELEIFFYNPDGTLYDFHGLDHSFVLEIVSISDIPDGSLINPHTGKNYNQYVI